MIPVKGIYKPGGTTYAVYKATFRNGDTDCAGAFSEEEYREHLKVFGYKKKDILKVEKLEGHEIENGYMEVNAS
jgi:hypothetical protein